MDFDQVNSRINTSSVKWDMMESYFGVSAKEGGIPLWVADMDFKGPEAVRVALAEAVDRGIWGYTVPSSNYKPSIIEWMQKRHQWTVEPDWILNANGIVHALYGLVQCYTKPGDSVIVQTPVYHKFLSAVTDNGRQLAPNPLVEKDGIYEMDFDHLESLAGPKTTMMILCSPHNPGGRVWSKAELERVAEICLANGILLVADEIHHDLVYGPNKHTTVGSLSSEFEEKIVSCTAASKTFNLAGGMTGNVIIRNKRMREQFSQQQLRNGMVLTNMFGPIMSEAAYSGGEEWLDALLPYLMANRDLVDRTLNQIPGVKTMPLESTYLSWIDFSETGKSFADVVSIVQDDAKLALNLGPAFGAAGANHLRLNFACPRPVLEEALGRLEKVLRALVA